MVGEVKWSSKAEFALDEIMKYLRYEVSLNAVQKFWEDICHAEKKIERNLGRPSMIDDSVRFVVVRKRYRLYYSKNAKGNTVILSFFDTRRNPDSDPYQ